MDADQQEQLRDVLVGYFGDRPLTSGVHDLLVVAGQSESYRQRYRGALEAGLRAVRDGDADVLPVVRQLSPFLPDLDAAGTLIGDILAEWDRQAAQV